MPARFAATEPTKSPRRFPDSAPTASPTASDRLGLTEGLLFDSLPEGECDETTELLQGRVRHDPQHHPLRADARPLPLARRARARRPLPQLGPQLPLPPAPVRAAAHRRGAGRAGAQLFGAALLRRGP